MQQASVGPAVSPSPGNGAEGSGRGIRSAPSAAAISLPQKVNQPNIVLSYLIYNCLFLPIILIFPLPSAPSAGRLPGASLLETQPRGQQSLQVPASLRGVLGGAEQGDTPHSAMLPVTTYITG